jgi:two-component system chemotaxis response regulator CheY
VVPRRLLVVDDYSPNRYALRRILGSAGYDVVEAADGKSAREALTESIDLVISDVNLPDVNGTDLCRAIRQTMPAVPVVLMSASYRAREEEEAWRAAGAAEFLEQPIEAEHLLQVVKALVG